MNRSSYIAGCIFSACLAGSVSVQAEEAGTAQFGDTTVSFGVGTTMLTLPDVTSMVTRTTSTPPFPILQSFKFSDDFYEETGWNLNGSIETPFGADNAIAFRGFWGRIEGGDDFTCTGSLAPQTNCLIAPLFDDPAVNQIGGTLGANSITSNADRTVDIWGGSVETKWFGAPERMGIANGHTGGYFSVGADIRGIYQDLDVRMNATTGAAINYNEELDTTYYGAFVAYGSNYSPLLFGSLWEKLGLESSSRVQGGVYYANTDYSGNLSHSAPFPGGGGDPSGALSLSSDDAAFIGGLTLETRKHLSPRTMLSLKSTYEYYSWVPKMAYNNTSTGGVNLTNASRQVGTEIGSDDAFSMSTMLTLTIGLGPDSLFKQ